MKTHLNLAGYAIVATMVLAACGSATSEPVGDDSESRQFIELTRDEARDGGASDHQLAALDRIMLSGAVTIDEARDALRNAVDCMVNAGVMAQYTEETTSAGVILPGFAAQIPDDDPASEGIIDQCELVESHWISKLYQLQPSSQDAVAAYREDRVPQMRSCLEDNGIVLDESATEADHVAAGQELIRKTDFEVNCFWESGFE